MLKKDFRNFATKHIGVNGNYYDAYSKIGYTTQHVLDDATEGIMVDIFSKLIESRIIFLCTDINPDSCNIIKAQLLYLEQLDPNKDIKIYIDSPGGDIYSGLGLLDTMDYISPDIVTVNTGLAASMGSILLACGTKGKRKSLKRARTMIHQPLSGSYGYSQASDVEIDAREVNSLKRELYEILAERTGQVYSKIEKDADRDYWMTADDALRYGIIDEIVKKK